MAETHSIVVYIQAGRVQRVSFCECCPSITVEVRTYEDEPFPSLTPAGPVTPTWPERLGNGQWRDHEGTYRAVVYDADAE